MEPMWADLGLEEMPSEVSSSGVSSNELSELKGGWGSEMDTTSCSSEETESTSGGSVSDTGLPVRGVRVQYRSEYVTIRIGRDAEG